VTRYFFITGPVEGFLDRQQRMKVTIADRVRRDGADPAATIWHCTLVDDRHIVIRAEWQRADRRQAG
jgi:hypothetical protein